MKLVDHSTGQLVDVPEAQAPDALKSGQYGLPKGAPVPVVGADGKVGQVSPEKTQAVIDSGGRFASAEEHRKAALENEYGGLGGGLAATGEGLVRGASLGLSDPLAVGAARLFGGDTAAEKTRQHLALDKEAHPWLAGGGELVGAAAPMLLSGGATAPEQGAALAARGGAEALEGGGRVAQALTAGAGAAEVPNAVAMSAGAMKEAGVAAHIGEGVRTLGALPRGVGALGDYAEHAVSGMLGAPGATVLGRAGQAAAKTAVRGIVEGGLFGAGGGISEASLQDPALVGEKAFSTIGHSAFMGALTGGVLGGALGGFGKLAGEGVGALLGKAGPQLEDAAAEQGWKWLAPAKKFSTEATTRAGGTSAVGRTVIEEVLQPLVNEKGLAGAAISNEEKLDLVKGAGDRVGKSIGDLVRGNAAATVPLADMLKPIEELSAKMKGQVMGAGKVSALDELKADVIRILGVEPEAASPVTKVPRTNEEIGAYLRQHPEVLQEMGNGPLPEHVRFNNVSEPVPQKTAEEVHVPIADAIAQRRALQQVAFEETKAIDPKLRVQLLRDVSSAWNELEVSTLNKAGEAAGTGLEGDRLRKLNKTYQHLAIAEKALENNTSRYASNNSLSLGDNLWGAAHFAGALASGHPLTAGTAIATSYGHKLLREHGNAYAAIMLDRLATWGGVSRAAQEVDEQVNRFVDTAVARETPYRSMPRARAFHTESGGDTDERFDKEKSRIQQLANVAPALVAAHMQERTAPVATHAPQVAQAMQATATRATSWLASQLPPEPMPAGLTPQLQKNNVSTADKASFLRKVDAVEGGMPHIVGKLANGTITPEDVAASQTVFQAQHAEVVGKLRKKLADRAKPVSYQQGMRLSQFMGTAADATQAPDFLQAVHTSYAKGRQAQAAAPKASPARLSISKTLMGPFERAQRGDSR